MSTFKNDTPGKPLANPFVGLRAFEESEDYLFFGRNKQIDELLKKFSESHFLAVIGASGSGKSSLVKSGLLPAIYSGFMTVASNWRVALMRPGENPIGYLTKELAAEGTLYAHTKDNDIPYKAIIESSLRRSENGLVQVYKEAHISPDENLLIIVDQFEELFRFSKYEKDNKLGKSDAIHFIQILLTAAGQIECPIYVLLTMRSDFLGDCAEFRGLPEAINNGQYLVPRMIRDEIREAITGPVTVSKATIAQRLVTRLLNDVNNDTDQLPVLQHALMRTWDAWYMRNQHDTPIDFKDYEKIGTMESALSQHADEAYAELTAEKEQQVCELMFKALTDKAADIRGIRRPRSIADLCVLTGGTEAQVRNIIEIFRKQGRTFLMPPPRIPLTDRSIIDISHESLMRVWQRLVKWTEEEARSGDVYMRLVNSAQLKELGQRGLLKNPELEISLRWKEKNNPSAKWAEGYKGNFEQAMAYLEDSRREDLAEKNIDKKKEATRKRLVKLVIVLLGLLVLAGCIVAFILNIQRKKALEAQKKAEESEKRAIALKTAADNSNRKAQESAVYAFAQKDTADIAKNAALKSDSTAHAQKDTAVASRKKAQIAEKHSKEAGDSTQLVLDKIRNQTLKIAANEYARLIRDGPSLENKNSETFYGSDYLLAYSYHFNQLKNLIADTDRLAYNSLKNKLYYNNDLYQRVYKKLEYDEAIDAVIKRDNLSSLTAKISDAEKAKLFETSGQKLIAFAVSKKQHLIFCSTPDNFIDVYNDATGKVGSIAMGTKVAALDFNDDSSIIYFGTINGYIGYIRYGIDKRNQPVFENKLETEITAIQFFKHNGQPFLLATGKKSNPVVYKLEENSLTPNNRLKGNELPYIRAYGDITNAEYKKGRVLLVMSGETYIWNPFTDELLNILNKREDFHPGTSKTNVLIKETQIY